MQGGGGCAQPHVCRGPDLYMKDEYGYSIGRSCAPKCSFFESFDQNETFDQFENENFIRFCRVVGNYFQSRKYRVENSDTGRCTGTATRRIHLHTPGSKANNEGAGANDGGSRSAIALLVTRYAFAIDERCAGTA